MSSNKDSFPSSSPIPSICAIETEAVLSNFHDELLQVFIPRMYYNYRIENRANEEPAAILFTTRKDGIPPPPVRLSSDSRHPPQESVRTDGWTYADVRNKIFRINGLPNLLTHGAPRAPLKTLFWTNSCTLQKSRKSSAV